MIRKTFAIDLTATSKKTYNSNELFLQFGFLQTS